MDKMSAEAKLKLVVGAAQARAGLKKDLETALTSLARTAETTHPYLVDHLAGVAQIATAIAHELGLSKAEVDDIGLAASVHDVGMGEIPRDIVDKAKPLTKKEISVLRTHSKIGSQKLEGAHAPGSVARVALEHHERMNGSGYPKGLPAELIAQESRIVAVADVIEAITSHHRRHGFPSLTDALAFVQGGSGTLFDEEVVEAAINVIWKSPNADRGIPAHRASPHIMHVLYPK